MDLVTVSWEPYPIHDHSQRDPAQEENARPVRAHHASLDPARRQTPHGRSRNTPRRTIAVRSEVIASKHVIALVEDKREDGRPPRNDPAITAGPKALRLSLAISIPSRGTCDSGVIAKVFASQKLEKVRPTDTALVGPIPRMPNRCHVNAWAVIGPLRNTRPLSTRILANPT